MNQAQAAREIIPGTAEQSKLGQSICVASGLVTGGREVPRWAGSAMEAA
jgi:hypothetical protein